ncbi:hypothetical protein ABEB36_014834 [Hypothenemus hampei]|uniref:Nuclease HARBI1 n=1 Tax=Hypothenemus hampei TaxID=57062 RepID=A0ABD1E333_HYPHA
MALLAIDNDQNRASIFFQNELNKLKQWFSDWKIKWDVIRERCQEKTVLLANESFLKIVGDVNNVHESTTSRVVYQVCVKIAELAFLYITFPDTCDEKQEAIGQFKHIARFLRCVGVIDYTRIKIPSPGCENVENFMNQKGYFSRLQHTKVKAIIVACAVLHNIACETKDDLPSLEPEDEELLELENNIITNVNLPNNRDGYLRYSLIYCYF